MTPPAPPAPLPAACPFPLFPEAVDAAEMRRVLRSLPRLPYRCSAVRRDDWPGRGWGARIKCEDRVVGEFPNDQIEAAMYRDYVNTGGNP